MPFSAVHALLGFLGVVMNVFTGMLMMIADTYRYVVNDLRSRPRFSHSARCNRVLYFSLSDDLWKVKAGDDAPMAAKWVPPWSCCGPGSSFAAGCCLICRER